MIGFPRADSSLDGAARGYRNVADGAMPPKVALAATVTAPAAFKEPEFRSSAPPATVVVPEKLLTALRVNVPGPIWTRPPLPVMPLPLKSIPCATALLRLKASVPLTIIVLPLASEPVEPPVPICKVPALTVVEPL